MHGEAVTCVACIATLIMKWKARLATVGTILLVIAVWLLFIHNPGFRKHPRHDSTNQGAPHLTESKEAHPTLKGDFHQEALPVGEELHMQSKKTIAVQEGKLIALESSLAKLIDYTSVWDMWMRWPHSDAILPEGVYDMKNITTLLQAMAVAPVERMDVGYRGTQLKASLHLKGGQVAVFKPKRYEADMVIREGPYAGFDRHDAEIAAFHLDAILGFRRAPPVVGRRIDLEALQPVTSGKLRQTFFQKGGNTCFYGVCYYCKREDAACARGSVMEGAVIIWLPHQMKLKTWRHPYQRTYRDGVRALWEKDDNYCRNYVMKNAPYNAGPRLLDVMETAVFDYIIGNADRHHYETFEADGNNGRLLHLDNGKGFRSPYQNERSILAPLQQCCRFRRSTWERLKTIWNDRTHTLSERLRHSLEKDPLAPVLHEKHLFAIDGRFEAALLTIQECIAKYGEVIVLV